MFASMFVLALSPGAKTPYILIVMKGVLLLSFRRRDCPCQIPSMEIRLAKRRVKKHAASLPRRNSTLASSEPDYGQVQQTRRGDAS